MALNKKLLLAFFSISLFFFSCDRNKDSEIPLDNSDPLALAPDIRWALVNDPYAAFRADTSWDAEAVAYCKQGDLFPILASATTSGERGSETWYLMERGWLPESVVSIYPNKFRAAKAAAALGAKK